MDGCSRRSSAKLEQPGQLFLVKGLHDFPEPFDDLMVGVVLALVVGVELPILDIDVGHSIQQHL